MSKTVTIFDVGFGDSIYIKINDIKETRTYLIDCGYPRSIESKIDYLRKNGVDYVILTHKHSDHISGLEELIEKEIPIKGVIVRMDDFRNHPNNSAKRLLELYENNKIILYDIFNKNARDKIIEDFRILYPDIEGGDIPETCKNHSNANRNSIVLSLEIDEGIFLFMGDATKAEEKIIIASREEDLKNVKYIKIGHHGSETSTGEKFLEAVGEGWCYGFVSCNGTDAPPPHERVLNMLEGKVMCTETRTEINVYESQNGDIRCSEGDRIERV